MSLVPFTLVMLIAMAGAAGTAVLFLFAWPDGRRRANRSHPAGPAPPYAHRNRRLGRNRSYPATRR